jgi:hypothetical protein
MQEGAPSADPSSLALCRAVDFCRVGIAHRCEPPRPKTVGNAHPTMAHSAPRRVYQRLATSEADSFSLDKRGRTQACFHTCGWRPFAFQCGLGGFPAIGPLTNVESTRILDSVLFHPAIAVGHINCLSEPFLAAALNQRPSRLAVEISTTGLAKWHGAGMATGFDAGFWLHRDVDSLHSDATFLSEGRSVRFANTRDFLLW